MNQAYITLLSSFDYLPAILILNRNLKELNCRYPLVVMVTEDIISLVQKYLAQESIIYYIVPVLSYSDITVKQYQNNSVLKTASKINLFNLKQYNKLVYIDADSFFLTNIDNLFDYFDGAMYDDGSNVGFSGLFVCNPNNHNFEYYYNTLKNFPIWDGDLLGTFWFPFKENYSYRIPFEYFINITLESLDDFELTSIKGIHFCYNYKPWKYNFVEDYIIDYSKEFKIKSNNRYNIIRFYINYYLIPLKKDYPDIFKTI